MVLDARLRKLATGVSAAEAAEAHAKSRRPGELLSAVEQVQAAEFEATLEAMFLMAAVDGNVSREELEQLAASFQAIVDMHDVKGLDLSRLLETFNEKLARDGWRARLEKVGTRITDTDARGFAFRLAAGVAFVDDHVAHAEAAAIEALARAFNLSPEESQAILQEVHEEIFG
jgi:tellurite resistance protein